MRLIGAGYYERSLKLQSGPLLQPVVTSQRQNDAERREKYDSMDYINVRPKADV